MQTEAMESVYRDPRLYQPALAEQQRIRACEADQLVASVFEDLYFFQFEPRAASPVTTEMLREKLGHVRQLLEWSRTDKGVPEMALEPDVIGDFVRRLSEEERSWKRKRKTGRRTGL
jgi:hypothetical protein